MTEEELLSLMALTKIPGLGSIGAKNLLTIVGDAVTIFHEREHLEGIAPGVTPRLIKALDTPEAFRRAEQELLFIRENHIDCLSISSDDYPSRLRECDDAPILLYYKGNTNLNAFKVINLIGTRNATAYGKAVPKR